MSKRATNQGSFCEGPEELSDAEESIASFGLGDLDSERSVILKDWSARDFANIYVRFRPHLVTHARKFLRDETQAEEVVQDAFLYLMTALPELDSDLGVLRYLKWKTKMLCIDILRSSSLAAPSESLDFGDHNLFANEPDVSTAIEVAEDSALVQLALSKLSLRQREALLATVYEGKSYEELATHLGLENNAARQLVHRARKSFRKALIGEVNAQGKSISEILSLAARRHRRSLATTSGLTAIILAFIAIIPLEVNGSPERLSATTPFESSAEIFDRIPLRSSSPSSGAIQRALESGQLIEATETLTLTSQNFGDENRGATPAAGESVSVEKSLPGGSVIENSEFDAELSRLGLLVDELFMSGEFSLAQTMSSADGMVSDGRVELALSSGNSLLSLALLPGRDSSLLFMQVSMKVGGFQLVAVPMESMVVVSENDDASVFSVAATNFVVGDLGGEFSNVVIEETLLSSAGIVVNFSVTREGRVTLIDLIQI